MATITRRRPAAPGERPPLHPAIVRRHCVICGGRYSLNRRLQPWSRAKTCGRSCQARLANRGRNIHNCRHCVLMELYYLARDTDMHEIEVACGDERPLLTFREFLTGYRFEQPDPNFVEDGDYAA